ncbi:UNVERIFIED_CONTAM: hypothetical protein Scaly_2505600 [Sesamum calycinum]|uniref:CCHC-type domain-containing protein n=1 Tax=Sesamum calycinum TaxID=2727403 RepID=A0AAW2LUX6_9LAMI
MEANLGRLSLSLTLTAEEKIGVLCPAGLWHTDALVRDFFVVCHLVSSKSFPPEALQSTLRAAFNPVKGMDFKLLKVEVNDDPKMIDLSSCDFHIHIHSLPMEKMNQEVASFIGNKLGIFKEVELDRNGEIWGSSVRIRVSIDVSKPLKRALKLRIVLGDENLVTFTYERLQNFCYLCGCLGHLSHQCEIQLQEGFSDLGDKTPYGNWLRATAPLSSRGRISENGVRDSGGIPRHPTFTSRNSLQSQPELPPPRRGSAIFGNFGDPWIVQHLQSLIRANNPSLVFLAETKCTSSCIESVKRSLDMNGIYVPSRGIFGASPASMVNWTPVKGIVPSLFYLASMLSHSGPGSALGTLMKYWINPKSAPTTVRPLFDKACANSGLSSLFPDVSINHVPMTCSDHAALLIRLADTQGFGSKASWPWRFEAAWLQSAQCEQVVADSWMSALRNIQETVLSNQIACCQANLKRWSLVLRGDKK